jgi:hypothetical protein
LDNWKVISYSVGDGKIEETLGSGFVYHGLEKISNKDKEKWGKRVPLSHSSFAVEDLARNSIKQD